MVCCFKREPKLEAVVFLSNGEAVTRKWATEQMCNVWIDNMIKRYGVSHVVACDIYPAQ